MISSNLERHFHSFIEETNLLNFSKGLAEYLEYVFSVPELKNVFSQQLGERNADYAKLNELAEKNLAEIKEAKTKLIKCLKKRKIYIDDLNRIFTHPHNTGRNFFEELDAFEKGDGLYSSMSLADVIDNYLFDMAVNLLNAGYQEDVEEFLARPDDYTVNKVCRNDYIMIDGHPGSFVFSRAYFERQNMKKFIEQGRVLKTWGEFEKLYQFRQGYKESLGIHDPMKDWEHGPGEFGIDEDLIYIARIHNELNNLVKKHGPFPREDNPLEYLSQSKFVQPVKTVHNILMLVASSNKKEEKNESGLWISKNKTTGEYYFDDNKIHFPSPNAKYVKIFETVYEIIPKGGRISYSQITKYKKSEVQRALTGENANFFHYVKSARRTPQKGIPLFHASSDGKELIFNNQR